MRKIDKYDVWYVRIFVFMPVFIFACILWIIIGLFSLKSMVKVIGETVKDIQK